MCTFLNTMSHNTLYTGFHSLFIHSYELYRQYIDNLKTLTMNDSTRDAGVFEYMCNV